MKNNILCGLLLVLSYPIYALTDEEKSRLEILREFSLEELQELEVYNPAGGLAARKEQKLLETAGALFIISNEEIRRGGFTSIPEALRMVLGLQVARIDGNKWAISARGFNSRFAGKLLVMIDGRTVYSLLRSEVYWDVQDTLIEDVERIEVLRGAGAALWGSNAVNGIINIVTKTAAETQGGLLSIHSGTGEEKSVVGLRYGDQISDNKGHYRIYGKRYDFDFLKNPQNNQQDSRWQTKRAGGRSDWKLSEYDSLTVQGDAYDGWTNQETISNKIISAEQIKIAGHNLLARWYRELKSGDLSLQAYYDSNERREPDFEDYRKTFDLDFQHRINFNPRTEFIWGLSYRYTSDKINGNTTQYYTPNQRHDQLASSFVHIDYALIPKELRLLAGSKFSWDTYSGFEIQPSVRLLWQVSPQHQLWSAISRAVRTPSRTDEDFNLIVPMGKTMQLRLQGDPNFKSEEVLAYELGWRWNLSKSFLLDTALFYNQYYHLGPYGKPSGFIPPNTIVQTITNGYEGHTFGLETAAHWQIQDNWKIVGTYHFIKLNLKYQADVSESGGIPTEKTTPYHQASLRSLYQINKHWQWDNALYYVDNIPINDIARYLRFDSRLAWLPNKNLEIALGVRNLFDDRHPEFKADVGEVNSEVSRTIYAQFKYLFGK